MVRPLQHADVEADMGHAVRAAAEEDQVARLEDGSRPQRGAGVELVLGHPGQGDAGHPVGRLGQSRAVEADPRRLAAPHVGRAHLGQRPGDGDLAGVGPGRGGCDGAGRALAAPVPPFSP